MQANQAIKDIVFQIEGLLEQIPSHDYRRPLSEFDGSTLGQHFRHILEFFQCLENGMESGAVDYASRKRNLLYEDNPALTSQAFSEFLDTLGRYTDDHLMVVKAEFGGSDRPTYQSCLGRELLFIYDHAIHHLAIIKIGLRCHFPQIQIDKDLGVSPSTIKARQLVSDSGNKQ
ncbi:MAG: hypothetical protein JNJ57_12845 [Saprospiraceae bacterium]|nr:hypothetical protein [Saprospiraceae bacterium]